MAAINRVWIVLTVIVVSQLLPGSQALTCKCDDQAQCKAGSCQATKNWFGPEHCQINYDPSVNGDRAWKGCTLANSNCDIVSEGSSVDVTFTKGQLTSFSGCCSEENCNGVLESKLGQVKNKTCSLESNQTATDFSCHCDPSDMVALFDLSVERGVQWLSTAIGTGQLANGSNVYESTSKLRRRMSSFCTNNMCSASTMVAAGITIPTNSFPVCAHLTRADTGKTIRGCTFAPNTVQKDRRAQSTFPSNPIAGQYDIRIGLNASSRYSLIFECRMDMCNERQDYENVIGRCLTGIDSSRSNVAVEPVEPVVAGVPATTQVPVESGSTAEAEAIPEHNHAHGNETESVETTVHNHVHASTDVPPVVPGDANATVVVHDATTHQPSGSAATHLLHMICLIPVLALAIF